MASPDILNFDSLLAPIPGDRPAGPDLREDRSPKSAFQAIKMARAQARASERQAMMDEPGSGTVPEWKIIMKEGQRAVAELSKDLEVTAFLTESLVREHGFAGLRDGFRLARQLVEKYWDHLNPMPNEDGVVNRVAALAGLNGVDGEGTLIGPINRVPLTSGKSVGPYSRADYKQAGDLEGVTDPDKRAARVSRGAVTLEMFQRSVNETPADFFRNLHEDLTQCEEEFDKLSNLLDEKCGNGPDGTPAAPPSSSIRGALAECHDVLRSVAKAVLGEADSGAGDGSIVVAGASGPANGGASGGSGRLQSRDEAFQQLLRVAQFFRQSEPHSPVAYALEQAVRWGRMPLPILLQELISDDTLLRGVYQRIGIKPDSADAMPGATIAASLPPPLAPQPTSEPPRRLPGTPRS